MRNTQGEDCTWYETEGYEAECDWADGQSGFVANEMCCACGGGSTYHDPNEQTGGKAEGEPCNPSQYECAEGLICIDVEDSQGNYVPMCTTDDSESQDA